MTSLLTVKWLGNQRNLQYEPTKRFVEVTLVHAHIYNYSHTNNSVAHMPVPIIANMCLRAILNHGPDWTNECTNPLNGSVLVGQGEGCGLYC